jgi:hypothetical protein
MTEHVCGPHCSTARYLARLSLRRLSLQIVPRVINVKTWCRICGVPVLMEVLNDYDQAIRHFYALDDTRMAHRGVHSEPGGWGVHWRLDDVLSVVFPGDHLNELWPMPPWWQSTYGETASEDQGVLILRDVDLGSHRDECMDDELRMLEKYINKTPREIHDLEATYGRVWTPADVAIDFEVFGFKSPFAVARCKRTGDHGSLIFQNIPRYYFGWDTQRVI